MFFNPVKMHNLLSFSLNFSDYFDVKSVTVLTDAVTDHPCLVIDVMQGFKIVDFDCASKAAYICRLNQGT